MTQYKILVTGGSGFIGNCLIKKLLKNNFYVKSLDLKKDNSINHKNFKFFKGDLFDAKLLKVLLKDCDIVIHLAAYLGVNKTDKNILTCLNTNILGTKNLLEICTKSKIKRFIFASSSEVYGDQKKFPLFENFETQNKSVYGISKIVGENYLKGFFQKYKMSYNIIRFFNVYGPGQKENFVISKYLHRIKKNKPIEVYGNGGQIRSFCYVEDAVNGILSIIFRGKKNTTYNVGNNQEPISILKLAKLITKIFKRKIFIKKVEFNKSDRKKEREIFKRIPSIRKLSKDTNFSPQVSLIDGILKIINDKKLIKNNFLKRNLGIGTLQFGLKYGIANKSGKINNVEIKKIREISLKNNINVIDTAQAYGDSENRIGKFNFTNFKLITKLPVTKPKSNIKKWVIRNVKNSLRKLKTKKIYCMHVHNTKYLLEKKGNQIYQGLLEAKKEGLIDKIGVSIYTIKELNKIIEKFDIDLVLIPFNIFDQRTLKNNYLKKLKSKDIEIHARSVFLQGLLNMPNNSIPKKFKIYKKYFRNWENLVKKHKLKKHEACLKYVLSNKYIDMAIVGIDNSSHLRSLIKAVGYLNIPLKSVDASNEIKLINPSKW